MSRILSLVALIALAFTPVAALADYQITVVLGSGLTQDFSQMCSSQNGLWNCSSGGSLTVHDSFGSCTFSFQSTHPVFGQNSWSVFTSNGCSYNFQGQETLRLNARTHAPGPTPTPFNPPHTPTPAPTPTPVPQPALLVLTLKSPLTYVSGPCVAVPSSGGQLGSGPSYNCSGSGTIVVKAGAKLTCAIGITPPPTWQANGSWTAIMTGTCRNVLKGGNQLDIRPR